MDMKNSNSENGVFSQNTEVQQAQNVQENVYGDAANIPPAEPVKDETVSVLDWLGTILLSCVPCVGLIIYIIWAFSKDTKKSKANFCKAQLIVMLIAVVIYIILFVVIMAVGIGAAYMDGSY